MPDIKQNPRSNSTKQVWIGCKLPTGVVLELFDEAPPMPDPSRIQNLNFAIRPLTVKARVTLKGANSVRNDLTMRGLAQPVYQFGITAVSAEFWHEWLGWGDNAKLPFMKNGLVFSVDRERDAAGAAAEREPERTGLEPLNQAIERDPRMPPQRNLPLEQRVEADKAHLAKLNSANGR
ncbi:MAG: hypothetical protein ACYCT1_05050 [Steroidobacteraceae bacterium]